MLYAAQTLSLACLEVLVHLDKRQLPQQYVWSETNLEQEPAALQFSDIGRVSSCQLAGQSWIGAGTSLAAKVPSVIIPSESNILLNPQPRRIRRSALERSPTLPIRSASVYFGAPNSVATRELYTAGTDVIRVFPQHHTAVEFPFLPAYSYFCTVVFLGSCHRSRRDWEPVQIRRSTSVGDRPLFISTP
jgi:hypothetical protein